MVIGEINASNVDLIAKFMSSMKPDWWDFEGAYQQLQDVSILAKLVGWYMNENSKVKGWILCAEFSEYSYLSIENLGYDENGNFVMEEQLEPLLKRAEDYAKNKGLRNLKYIIGSTDMSCHGKQIANFADELKNLKSYGRKHFDFFKSYGFVPTGFIPNCYGANYHGIIMIKQLRVEGD